MNHFCFLLYIIILLFLLLLLLNKFTLLQYCNKFTVMQIKLVVVDYERFTVTTQLVKKEQSHLGHTN